MDPRHSNRVLDRFFTGVSEYVFHTRLGVVDPQLIDYVSGILIRFTRIESTERVRAPNGQPVTQIATMLNEADHRIGPAKREALQHIGDYALFWSGLYPESLRRDGKDDSDQFVSYCAQGKRSYRMASSIEARPTAAPTDLLLRLSEQFELCAYGLREIRREWERGDAEGSSEPPLLI